MSYYYEYDDEDLTWHVFERPSDTYLFRVSTKEDAVDAVEALKQAYLEGYYLAVGSIED